MKWFGPYSWGAPICEEAERVDVPHGDRCAECGHVIYPHDRGFLIPQFGLDAEQSEQPFHFRCLMGNTLGPDWEKMIPGAENDSLFPMPEMDPTLREGIEDDEVMTIPGWTTREMVWMILGAIAVVVAVYTVAILVASK